jgi:GNAT superfamily N-acetyltransferase
MLSHRYISEDDKEAIENFQCDSEPTVKEFLVEQAYKMQQLKMTSTKLFFDGDNKLIGYFTLYNDMMKIGKEKRVKHGLSDLPSVKYYPAVKLHYLGVDSRYQKIGYGKELLFSALDTVSRISEESGCIFMSVESLKSSVDFYYKYEFQHLSDNKPFTNMFFKIGEF